MQKKEKLRAHSKQMLKKRKRQREIAIKLGACVILLLVIAYVVLWWYVNKLDKAIAYNNVHIGAVDVSGLTAEEAMEALNVQMEDYSALDVTMKLGEASIETSLRYLGFSMSNMDEAVKCAIDYGKTGSIWKRFLRIRGLEKEIHVIEDTFQVDTELMAAFINEYVKPLEVRAQNATIRSTESGFEITDEIAGAVVNAEESIEAFATYLNTTWSYESFEFEMKQSVEEPRIKRTDLEQIKDTLGTFYTDAGGGARCKNIKRAAELLNGIVLMPGDELSVEKMTSPYTLENGYVEGSAYENGQIVQSIGGGLCQASSTLYNAVLYAELEIVTRSAHSMLVNYVEPSRDAAIASGAKDLIFKNSYEYPVLIEGYINDSGEVWFCVYGKETRPANRKVEYISETLEEIPYTKKFVGSADQTIGVKENVGSKINGKKAKLWKVVYEDGVEVSRTTRNNSNYKSSELTIKIGIASSNAEATKIMKEAIATQNEDKINEAIDQAKALENAVVNSQGEADAEEAGEGEN